MREEESRTIQRAPISSDIHTRISIIWPCVPVLSSSNRSISAKSARLNTGSRQITWFDKILISDLITKFQVFFPVAGLQGLCSQSSHHFFVAGVMSSNDKAEVIVDQVPRDQVPPEEVVECENMDLTMLDSSDHEDGEQGRKVDEAIHQESGIGTDNAKSYEEMEDNVDKPKVGADTVKPEDEMEVAGNINQEVGNSNPTNEDEELTLNESDEVKGVTDDGNLSGVLDQYLEILMTDNTMSVVKAMKAGDVVVLIPCPHMDHKVNLKDIKGFFMVDLADMARKTKEKQLEFTDNSDLATDALAMIAHILLLMLWRQLTALKRFFVWKVNQSTWPEPIARVTIILVLPQVLGR